MIILEGPDGGGKSTLAEHLCEVLGREHLRSEGPEKYPGEINERIRRYHDWYGFRSDIVFDRHPCVSQIAYGLVHDQPSPDAELVEDLYKLKPLFIYCRPDVGTVTHTTTGEWDTPEYLANVDKNYPKLMGWYDRWAIHHAHYIYRIGDHYLPIEKLIKNWIV